MKHQSTKTYGDAVGLSSTFRQWRADSHCNTLHGYALQVGLVFEADELDERNWVIDFGSLKPVKQWLADMFDHKTLVAKDDPEYDFFLQMSERGIIDMVPVEAVGCEAFAMMIAEHVQEYLVLTGDAPRVRLKSVEVREHDANSGLYFPE
jgi:6-pyruvoyltetrahydropterin/6-carboxytetrahydropterin synthase